MNDLTYDKKEIEKDPVWRLAFYLSEMYNDNAPIGWARFIPTAKEIIKMIHTKPKDKP